MAHHINGNVDMLPTVAKDAVDQYGKETVIKAVKGAVKEYGAEDVAKYAAEHTTELGVFVGPVNPQRIHDAGFLNGGDGVAVSFWIISIAMVASTFFFLAEANHLKMGWKTSCHVGSLVTLVAAVHYFYMREYWVLFQQSPVVYRYIDWSITVPLQMVEFYLILSAVDRNLSSGMFWRLLIGTVVMLAFGYAGESRAISPLIGFVGGMAGWGFILLEIFAGEASKVAVQADKANRYIKSAFDTCRLIVTVGWSIYPLGYFFGYLLQGINNADSNLIYNLADFVNKIAFCLAIWWAGKQDTLASA